MSELKESFYITGVIETNARRTENITEATAIQNCGESLSSQVVPLVEEEFARRSVLLQAEVLWH
jgi:hypothetical protein